MHVLLYFSNQQPQAWDESFEMIFNIVVRFYIQYLKKKASTFQA